ncbi:MAG TPA: hypothetical protein VG710_02715 [Opitutus sp.]|nr:hypothetical protein [Opitutus sp.]
MNKTLLLVICDFLLLNLLALTRWEKAEPPRPNQPPVPKMEANAATKENDLVATMRQSLEEEHAAREQLAQQLTTTQGNLGEREQNLAKLQAERTRLASALTETQRTAAELNQQVVAATQQASMTKEELARLQHELEQRRDEAARQKSQLAAAEKEQAAAQEKIQDLNVRVGVAEREKQILQDTTQTLRTQVAAEREERMKVQETTAQLAGGVGELAEKTGGLTKEIRDNRPINANVLFDEFLKNQVTTNFTAVRSGLFGPAERSKTTATVLVTDGEKVYALLHISDTPFPLYDPLMDWQKISVSFGRPSGEKVRATELDFVSLDPRVIVLPIDTEQASKLGVKVYPTALEPFKFPEAVLVSGTGKGYGEVGFKLDPSQPGYVRVDNSVFKRLFGDFAPSRGDLVLSKTGELLGIMVNSNYCVIVNNFLAAQTVRTGETVDPQKVKGVLVEMAARWHSLPVKLQ